MPKLMVFNHVSLDGYFVDANNSMMWAKPDRPDPEWNAFAAENAKGDATLVFGRVTYQMMASYWPTPIAAQRDPIVAKRMNELPKIVFSRTLNQASWTNTTLIKTDPIAAIRKMKRDSAHGLCLLGSGSIVSQLAPEGLIDEFQIVVNPIILGKGRTMFDGVTKNITLKMTESRAFTGGNVYLRYEPA